MFMQAFYLCVVVARIGRHIHNYKNVSEEIKIKDEVHELQAAEHEEENLNRIKLPYLKSFRKTIR